MNAQPVLILGGGINGSAIARELILRKIPVVLVERRDINWGATSRSSRLIHGGLRYLEYGEFDLVRESLEERKRLLDSAPHLVRPLRLHTPVETLSSGGWQAIWRFFGGSVKKPSSRGMWLVRLGLWLYQKYAADPDTRPVTTHRPGEGEAPLVDPQRYRWVCSFDDGQALYPERLVVEWLEDARQAAEHEEVAFQVIVGGEATREGDAVAIRRPDQAEPMHIEPRLIINATGGWVDRTLERLEVPSKRLMGGTKGSHLLVSNAKLAESLHGDGVYAEARDGRPVFILPMRQVTLVGTTDIPFDDSPGDAVADQSEVDYLIDAVRQVFPQSNAERADVVAHYAGVRPLPYVDASTPAAVTRRHFLHEHAEEAIPIVSVIGGKLTTCRSLAAEAGDWVLANYGAGGTTASTESRPTPGGREYPESGALPKRIERIADETGFPVQAVEAIWDLYGTRAGAVLQRVAEYGSEACELLDDLAPLPVGLARYVCDHEWARSLEDVVERRLMLVYRAVLRRSWLEKLAAARDPTASPSEIGEQVDRCIRRLQSHYGRVVEDQ